MKKKTAVLIGRFSPFHKGHQLSLEMMIRENGVEKCLVIIGSSNSYNNRTPFTFERRKEMILAIFPKVNIIPLPDINPDLITFDGSTNAQWLDDISRIEKQMGTTFVFYGGSKEDLEILGERFETKVAVDRYSNFVTSATEIRKALDENDDEKLAELLDLRVLPLAKKYYQEFLECKK